MEAMLWATSQVFAADHSGHQATDASVLPGDAVAGLRQAGTSHPE
jgi:hypothetical protein